MLLVGLSTALLCTATMTRLKLLRDEYIVTTKHATRFEGKACQFVGVFHPTVCSRCDPALVDHVACEID